jgi:hypothetical protein
VIVSSTGTKVRKGFAETASRAEVQKGFAETATRGATLRDNVRALRDDVAGLRAAIMAQFEKLLAKSPEN